MKHEATLLIAAIDEWQDLSDASVDQAVDLLDMVDKAHTLFRRCRTLLQEDDFGYVPCDPAFAEPVSAQGGDALRVVYEQAEDEGLWFVYLQQALRRLHAAVEGSDALVTLDYDHDDDLGPYFDVARDAIAQGGAEASPSALPGSPHFKAAPSQEGVGRAEQGTVPTDDAKLGHLEGMEAAAAICDGLQNCENSHGDPLDPDGCARAIRKAIEEGR